MTTTTNKRALIIVLILFVVLGIWLYVLLMSPKKASTTIVKTKTTQTVATKPKKTITVKKRPRTVGLISEQAVSYHPLDQGIRVYLTTKRKCINPWILKNISVYGIDKALAKEYNIQIAQEYVAEFKNGSYVVVVVENKKPIKKNMICGDLGYALVNGYNTTIILMD